MQVVIEDWISQSTNLRSECEKIWLRSISDRTWYNWERLAGACYPQGKKVKNRQYTQEQAELLLCMAWLRKHYPRRKVTYKSLRNFYKSNEYKLDEVFQAFCEQDVSNEIKQQPKKITLTEVKKCCDQIMSRQISRNCWASWKQYLGIPKYEKFVEEGKASLLTYMACWRHDHPKKKFPMVPQLLMMMGSWSRRGMTLETASSYKMWNQWQIQGCKGKDLDRYLAACGYRVSPRTLYRWGDFSKEKLYPPSELFIWKNIAKERRHGSA
jgi:hypothetical protein